MLVGISIFAVCLAVCVFLLLYGIVDLRKMKRKK